MVELRLWDEEITLDYIGGSYMPTEKRRRDTQGREGLCDHKHRK